MHRGIMATAILILMSCCLRDAVASEEWHDDLKQRYAHATASGLEDLVDDETLERASEDPKLWANLCETLWIYIPYVARVEATRAVPALDAVCAKAAALSKGAKSTPFHQLAQAWSVMARCRLRREMGNKAPQPEWGVAAEQLLKIAGKNLGILVQAMTSFTEAAASPKADAEALIARGSVAKEQALAAVKDSEIRAVIGAGWHADLAKSFLRRKKKGPAKSCVTAGLAFLEPLLAKSQPRKSAIDAHHELACVNARGKLKVKGAEIRWKKTTVPLVGLVLDLPDGEVWNVDRNREGGKLNFSQSLLHGPYIRVYSVDAWESDGRLTLPDGSIVQTTDVKKLAAATAEGFDAHFNLSEIDSVSKPKRARLHKSLSDALVVIAEGTMQDSKRWARLHIYFFRSKEMQRTYRLTVYEYIRNPRPDPVADMVVKSLRVAKKR